MWVKTLQEQEEGCKVKILAAQEIPDHKKKDRTCPRVWFRKDLLEQLTVWREQGDRLIVCMDANEKIYKDHIGKVLTDEDGLGMIEAVGIYTGEQIGATFFRGTEPIDEV